MNQSDPNIDELLNSFIDGELTAGQRAEVEGLIAYNAQIARRFKQFQRTKMLVNSLPHAKAPQEMIERVKASLATGTPSTEQRIYLDTRKGTRQLFARRFLAAAAMITLVAILAGVVYTILVPETISERPAPGLIAVEPKLSLTEGAVFSGRLELKAGVSLAVDAFVNRAIEDNGLLDCVTITSQPNKKLYSLNCSRQSLNSLLADLESVWQRFDAATLFVDTERLGAPVVVDMVTAKQTAEITNQDGVKKSIEVAKDFAILNNMAEFMSAKQILDVIDDRSVALATVPKPFLTGDKKTASRSEEKKEVSLTIVVVGSE